MRLIDANKVIELIEDEMIDCDDDTVLANGCRAGLAYARSIVATRPTIDIVRCGECIHCADDYIDVGMGTMPQFTCELGRCGESVQPNDFCSYGERKDNETD